MPGPSGHSRRRGRGARSTTRGVASSESTDHLARPHDGDAAADDDEGSVQLSATDLFQNAQEAAAELKSALKTSPPWSREAESLRQRARNAYLAVLFQHPQSPHAQSIDLLWLNTTYSIIAAYRDITARIETVLPPPGQRRGNGGSKHGADPVADLRRTLARFRSALVAEDTFYRSLIVRVVAFYRLQDRTQDRLALVGLPIPPAADENSPGLAPPLSREEAEKKLGIVYKGLICLGDLERYKEQYSERARREAREGHDASRGADAADKFSNATTYYEVARGLQPDNGIAFNQLAVIDGYLGDNFHCAYHYFRALAVQQPFPSGEQNLERVFKKVFDRWRASRHADADEGRADETRDDGDAFKKDLLIALSIVFLKAGTSHLAAFNASLLEQFTHLLRARKVLSEAIVKTTAMVIGSHWHARLGPSAPTRGAPAEGPKLAERRQAVEELSLGFLFTMFTALVTVAADEIEDLLHSRGTADDSAIAEDDDPASDTDADGMMALAQNITAVVRRILPALRIVSRWIKANLKYIARESWSHNPDLSAALATFWHDYKRLMIALARLFPLAQLPGLDQPLEEDIDMKGFLPLRRGRSVNGGAEFADQCDEVDDAPRHGVHPNEEQLMRIGDLLVDVKLLMQTEAGATLLNTGTGQEPAALPDDSISVSVSTETEDDPVELAMRATLTEGSSSVGGDDQQGYDDDDEVIVWGRSTPVVHETFPSGPQSGQTAHELLQNLSLGGKQPHPSVRAAPSKPAPMLFGGDISGAGSIWTMSREESQKGVQRTGPPHPGPPLQGRPISAIWGTDQHLPQTPRQPQHFSQQQQQQPLPASTWGAPPPPGLSPHPPGISPHPPGLSPHPPGAWAQAPLAAQQRGYPSPNVWPSTDPNGPTWGPPAPEFPSRQGAPQWPMYHNS
ncbi:hypothetical protein Q8F55_003653 [Vanrija albida]|uniref:DNA/RNA-binding domain-containing protein n=1 Tax=Vanrija albida TaxID=181172 RepID=A0ABR3Q5B6_9TREE